MKQMLWLGPALLSGLLSTPLPAQQIHRAEQDLEIRKKLKMLHQNETEFILPSAPKIAQ